MNRPNVRLIVLAMHSGKPATDSRSTSAATGASDSLPAPTEYQTPCDALSLEQAKDLPRWRRQSVTPARQCPSVPAADARIADVKFPALCSQEPVRCGRMSRAAFRLIPGFH